MNPDHQPAREIIRRWVESLNNGQSSAAAGLYVEDAILLPTFSSHALTDSGRRLDYFKSLVGRPGLRVELHEATLRFHPLPAGIVIASGIYRFSFSVDGEPLAFEARFTIVMCPDDPKPIRHHHSSQVPRGLV